MLENKLNQLIEFRHGVVHRFDINLELKKEQIEEILDVVMAIVDEFVDYIENTRGVTVRG